MNNDAEKKEGGSACGCGGGSCCRGSGKWIWIALAVAVLGVLLVRNTFRKSPAASSDGSARPALEIAGRGPSLPRLVDLGAGQCIPCKAMAPILEDLRKTYAGEMEVVFIDVWENPDAKKTYGVNIIPTQIFYDAAGQELFRHEGFFGKDDILAKWKELGVELSIERESLERVSEEVPAD